MISHRNGIATLVLLAIAACGVGCSNNKQSDNTASNSAMANAATPTPSNTGSAPVDSAHKNKAIPVITITRDSGCYTDQPWVQTGSGGQTIQWVSQGTAAYTLEFNPTPLVDSHSNPVNQVTVPANPGLSTPVTTISASAVNACTSSSSLANCYFPYTIVKTNPTSSTDFCGSSPMTVGIHITP